MSIRRREVLMEPRDQRACHNILGFILLTWLMTIISYIKFSQCIDCCYVVRLAWDSVDCVFD